MCVFTIIQSLRNTCIFQGEKNYGSLNWDEKTITLYMNVAQHWLQTVKENNKSQKLSEGTVGRSIIVSL